MRNRRAGMAFIFITLLIDVLGFGVVIPILPKLVTQLAGGAANDGARYYGYLLSCYGLMQFFFAPILGRLSDRYGRRPVILLSMTFSCADYVIMALAPNVLLLFAGRILSGITGASFTAASAYIADVSPPEKRAQNFGVIGAAFGLGFILGPAIGGLLADYGLRAPFWAAAGLCLLNTLYGLFVLPESLAPENRSAFRLSTASPLTGLGILTRYPWVRLMAVSIAFSALAQIIMQSTWVVYTTYRYHWTPRDNGIVLALVGVLTGVVQVYGTKIVVDRIGEKSAVLMGQLLFAAGFFGFAISKRGWQSVAFLPLESLGGVSGPATQSLISYQYGPNEQGAVQGALTSLQSLMGVVAPVIGTAVFAHFTRADDPHPIPGSSYFLAAALLVIATVIAYYALRSEPKAPPVAVDPRQAQRVVDSV